MLFLSKPVNLIADKLTGREEARKQASHILAYTVLFAILGVALFYAAGLGNYKATTRLVTIKDSTKKLEQEHTFLQKVKTHAAEDIAASNWALGIRADTQRSRRAFRQVAALMPTGMCLDSITLRNESGKSSLEVSGVALTLEDIASFIGAFSGPGSPGKIMLESTILGDLNGTPVMKFTCTIDLNPTSNRAGS